MTKLLEQPGYSTNNEYGEYFVKLLTHIHEADPDGERYRYPHDKKGAALRVHEDRIGRIGESPLAHRHLCRSRVGDAPRIGGARGIILVDLTGGNKSH